MIKHLLVAGSTMVVGAVVAVTIIERVQEHALGLRADEALQVHSVYGETLAMSCRHLYNVGKSREWSDCMLVGPR